jgi:hypothetical protein
MGTPGFKPGASRQFRHPGASQDNLAAATDMADAAPNR